MPSTSFRGVEWRAMNSPTTSFHAARISSSRRRSPRPRSDITFPMSALTGREVSRGKGFSSYPRHSAMTRARMAAFIRAKLGKGEVGGKCNCSDVERDLAPLSVEGEAGVAASSKDGEDALETFAGTDCGDDCAAAGAGGGTRG